MRQILNREFGATVFMHILAHRNAGTKLKCEYPDLRYGDSGLLRPFPAFPWVSPQWLTLLLSTRFYKPRLKTASHLQYRFSVWGLSPRSSCRWPNGVLRPRRHFSLFYLIFYIGLSRPQSLVIVGFGPYAYPNIAWKKSEVKIMLPCFW